MHDNNRMINIACLDPEWFELILNGRKNIEYRRRKRIDFSLERVIPGEKLALFERRSRRVIICHITGINRQRSLGKYLYSINLSRRRFLRFSNFRHLQGWHRRRESVISDEFEARSQSFIAVPFDARRRPRLAAY